MKRLGLRNFVVQGEWASLLRNLPGWHQVRDDAWSDGDARVRLTLDQFGVGMRILGGGGTEPDLTVPSGLRVPVEASREAPSSTSCRFVMNHVAINTPRLALDSVEWGRRLGAAPIFSRTMVWEPVSQHFVNDTHFCRAEDFYIVLRERPGAPHVDHIGWMARARSDVDAAHGVVSALGWRIVIGPFEIDGSYLFHFQGPDGRVHDFFWPSDELRRLTEGRSE